MFPVAEFDKKYMPVCKRYVSIKTMFDSLGPQNPNQNKLNRTKPKTKPKQKPIIKYKSNLVKKKLCSVTYCIISYQYYDYILATNSPVHTRPKG